MTIMKYCTAIVVILNLKYVMSDDGFYYIINIQEEASENETFHLCSGATIHENLVLMDLFWYGKLDFMKIASFF